MPFELKDIVPHAVTFLGGGAVKVLFDYLKERKKAEAEAGKIEAEDESERVKTSLEIAARERDYGDRMDLKNRELNKENQELREENNKLVEINSEKSKMILDLQLKLERCQFDLQRVKPSDDRERGRRGDKIP